jgi:hypothetical protein
MEDEAELLDISIKGYHSDNVTFNEKEFRSHCKCLNQKLLYSSGALSSALYAA